MGDIERDGNFKDGAESVVLNVRIDGGEIEDWLGNIGRGDIRGDGRLVAHTVAVCVDISKPTAEARLVVVLYAVCIEIVKDFAANRAFLGNGNPIAEVDTGHRSAGANCNWARREGLSPTGRFLIIGKVLANEVLPGGQFGEGIVAVGIGNRKGLKEDAGRFNGDRPTV